MKLLFKQKMFSWFDHFDIYNENGDTVYTVEGKASFGRKLHILNRHGEHIATVKQAVFSMMPRFDFYRGDQRVGSLRRKYSLLKPHYILDINGWDVRGNVLEWDYSISDANGGQIAVISKQLLHLTDTYVIDTVKDEDALYSLMVVLSIDAEKASRNTAPTVKPTSSVN